MRSCPYVESVEDLALGKVVGSSAESLHRHLGACDECALAFVELEEERALFARRAATAPPPPPLVLPIEARTLDLLRVARRAMGGPSAIAAAAAILAFAGAARLGATSPIAAPSAEVTSGNAAPIVLEGPLASFRPREPLACAKDDDSAACAVGTSALAIAVPASDRASCESDDLLVSRAGAATCELAVTSSTSRQ